MSISKIDYTNIDYQGFKQMMIETLQELIPEYTDTSETDAGMVIFEAFCKGLDVLSYYQNSQANECLLVTAQLRSSAMRWCNILGYIPRSSTPSKYVQYFIIDENAGEILIPKGYIIRTKDNLSDAEYFTTLSDLKINTSKPVETQTGYVSTLVDGDKKSYVFQVDIAHGTLIMNEVVGVGDGETANQKYNLANTPVVLPAYDDDGYALMPDIDGNYPEDYDEARAFSVTVGGVPWSLKSSFVDSGSTSTDYRTEIAQDNTTTIIFGDGVNGKIPQGEIVVNYRKGGGTVGNVGAKTITVMPSPISGIKETYNPDMAYITGQDKESVNEIKLNAPNSFRTKWSCLIEEDFADRVIELFPQIAMATSFKITDNPDIDTSTLDVLKGLTDEFEIKNKLLDTVQLCVLVKDDIVDENGEYKKLDDFESINGESCAQLKQEVLEKLEARRIVGSFVELTPFTSKKVSLNCTLLPQTGYDFNGLVDAITPYLKEYFAIGNIKSGQTVSLNELEADVYANVKGVRAFRINSYTCGGVESTDLDIPSNKWEIVELDAEGTVILSSRG